MNIIDLILKWLFFFKFDFYFQSSILVMNFSYYLANFTFLINILIGINPRICDEDIILFPRFFIIGHQINKSKRIAKNTITIHSIIPRLLYDCKIWVMFRSSFSIKKSCAPCKYFCIFIIDWNLSLLVIWSTVCGSLVKLYRI